MKPDLPFEERLAVGKAFEELVSQFLASQGFEIGLHRSRHEQWTKGESRAHCEIKKDQKWRGTGNIFIETRERRNADGTSQWRPSGIYDEHKPWFYAVGSPSKLWFLAVKMLVAMHRSGRYVTKKTDTAEGFVVPVLLADQLAIKVFTQWCNEPDDEPEPQNSVVAHSAKSLLCSCSACRAAQAAARAECERLGVPWTLS